MKNLALAFVLAGVAAASASCSGNGSDGATSDPATATPAPPGAPPSGDGTNPPPAPDGNAPGADAGTHHDAGADAGGGPSCKKEITVVAAVGTGSGAVEAHSNGCWKVIDADGAANPSFRKCSTSSFVVKNAGGASYAYDDTNPDRPLSQDQSFLTQCAAGATGMGFEYMAYRGGWRLLTAPKMAAYFEELYSTDATINDYEAFWQSPVAGQTASPMINFGPNDPATIEAAALRMCKKVANKGYFGIYDGDWKNAMAATDGRAVALAKALNSCTGM